MSEFLIRFRLPEASTVSFSASWIEVDRWAEEGLPAPQTAVERRVLDWLRFGYRMAPTREGSGDLRRYVTMVVVFKVRTTPPPTIDLEPMPVSSFAKGAERRRQRLLRAVERLLRGDRPCVVACDSVAAAVEGITALCKEQSWPTVVWNAARGYVPEPAEYFPNWQSPDTLREGTGGVIYPHATPFFERSLWCLLAENIDKQALFLICHPPFDRLPDSGIGPLMAEVAAAHRRDGQFRAAVLQSDDRIPPDMGGDWDLVRLNVQSATPILDRYGTNLCEEARAGRLNRAYGVDALIHRMVTVLNAMPGVPSAPVLVGAAGTGKTAIVHELAYRLAQPQVDPSVAGLAGKQVVSLNTARMQEAADRMGGLPSVVNALATELSEADDTILYIDEVHQLAVSDRPGLPIGEVLKEALGRGLPLN